MPIRICHLYPDLLSVNGDGGNIIALLQRCQWRGIRVQLRQVRYGDPVSFAGCDFVFIGGGSDQGQALALAELNRWLDQLQVELASGMVLLAIGEGYQLLGRHYMDTGGSKREGLGLMPFYTRLAATRATGRIAVEVELGDVTTQLVGFENHQGKTILNGTTPLGRVLHGHGNNGEDGTEGARYKNIFCSYLQGPLLPLNPAFTDYLIGLVLQRKGYDTELTILDDSMEEWARSGLMQRHSK